MNLKTVGAIIFLILFVAAAIFIGNMTGNIINSETKVKLETNYGDMVIQLYPEKAPITVANFKSYVEEGFYDNTTFHRIIDNFMIQGGGFTSEGKAKQTHEPIKIESNNGLKNNRGTVAMARTSDPNSATSQFFINVVDNNFLDYGTRDQGYAVFGEVVNGMDVVDKIKSVQTGAEDVPVKPVIIIKARLLR